ncbi:MAG: hypothetical protein LBH84_04195 [Prevotellaceae bacterium]|jgi:hypothetical protein|nr:hypothetical protein [Prevotellaceae bacterium]
MKRKQIFTVAAMLTAASTFSCSKDVEVDKRDQFVGAYSAALTVITTGNTVLVSDTVVVSVAKSGESNFTTQVGFSIQQFAVSLNLATDSVFWHHAASKSSVFKIPEQTVSISGASAGTVSGVPVGASTGYHGGFGYAEAGVPKLSLKVSGSVSPLTGINIPITVTVSGTLLK